MLHDFPERYFEKIYLGESRECSSFWLEGSEEFSLLNDNKGGILGRRMPRCQNFLTTPLVMPHEPVGFLIISATETNKCTN